MAKKPFGRAWAGAWLAGAIGLAALPASAQVYICATPGGQAYRSYAPCPTTESRPGLIYIGPQQETFPARGSSYQPRTSQAAEELRYMSPRCASMQEALRTAGVRGIGAETVSELRRNFENECSDELRRARRQLREEMNEKRRQQEAESQNTQREVAAQQGAERLRHEQCAEMRKALASRKARPHLTEGELGDLARFEERYNSRCRQGP